MMIHQYPSRTRLFCTQQLFCFINKLLLAGLPFMALFFRHQRCLKSGKTIEMKQTEKKEVMMVLMFKISESNLIGQNCYNRITVIHVAQFMGYSLTVFCMCFLGSRESRKVIAFEPLPLVILVKRCNFFLVAETIFYKYQQPQQVSF